MIRSIQALIADLRSAIRQDTSARAEAMQRGLMATQPLSLVRLSELCALGDRMAVTALHRRWAFDNLKRAMAQTRGSDKPR